MIMLPQRKPKEYKYKTQFLVLMCQNLVSNVVMGQSLIRGLNYMTIA